MKDGNSFIRNLFTMISGTTIAQAIPILITPVLTRLYAPTDFGILTLFIACISIASVIVTARFELTVMLPKLDTEAINLIAISLLMSTCLSLLFFAIVLICNSFFLQIFSKTTSIGWLYLVPLTTLLIGFNQTFIYWFNRKKLFRTTIHGKILQGLAMSSMQIILYFATFISGLVWGYIAGVFASLLYFLITFIRANKKALYFVSVKKISYCLKKYKNYPFFSTWGALLDNTATQIPVFMLNKFYTTDIVGIFGLTFRILNLPMALLGSAVSQVLFQKIAFYSHQDAKQLKQLIKDTALYLTIPSVIFSLIIFYKGEFLFSFFLGSHWALSGKFASSMVFVIAIRFIISPLSPILALKHNIKLGSLWQFLYFCTLTTTLFIAAHYDIWVFIWSFVINDLVMYLLYFVLILRGTNRF